MKAKLHNAMKEALKARDKIRLDTIRTLLSAIQYEEVEKKVDDLSEEASLTLLQRELKKRNEELEYAKQAKREDLIAKIEKEIKVVHDFLPKQMSAEEIERLFTDLKTKTPSMNLGLAMKSLKEGYAGQYDSKTASEIAKRMFASS